MKTLEDMVKAYWNKEPGADGDLYKCFLYFMKRETNKIYYSSYKGQLSYDYDDLFQAASIAIFKACDIWNDIGLPVNIKASITLFIKHEILNMKKKINNRRYMLSMNNTLNSYSEDEFADSFKDDYSELLYEKINESIDNGSLRKELEGLILNNLSVKYQQVIRLRYGFEGRIYSYTEIADKLNISPDYVHTIEINALNILRNNSWVDEIGSIYYYGEKVRDCRSKIWGSISSQNDIVSFVDWNEKFSDNLSGKLLSIKKWGL